MYADLTHGRINRQKRIPEHIMTVSLYQKIHLLREFNFSHFPLCHLQQKTWRKIWLVLFKPSSTGVGRLEFYTVIDGNADPKKASRLRTPERKVVRLSDCLSVTPAPKESCPSRCTAFYLNTTQCTYTFASMTNQDWLSALSLLAFQVHVSS